jgi:hypothetical protein
MWSMKCSVIAVILGTKGLNRHGNNTRKTFNIFSTKELPC